MISVQETKEQAEMKANKKRAGKEKKISSEKIALYQMDLKTIHLKIKGTTSLIVHKFSGVAKEKIAGKQAGEGKTTGRGVRKPEDEFNAARYVLDEKEGIDGFPAQAFKKAAVRAGTYVDTKMVFLRGAFHVIGDLIPIKCKWGAEMRTDTVRIGMGTSDLRYRPEYHDWSAVVPIRYNASVITAEQIVNLFSVAGFAVGIGEWRPSCDGQFGMFEVELG